MFVGVVFFYFFLFIYDNLIFLLSRPASSGAAGAAEEERPLHRGSVSKAVQHQEHERHQRAAEQRRQCGHGRAARRSARRTTQSTFAY